MVFVRLKTVLEMNSSSMFKARLPLKNLRIETFASNDFVTTEATSRHNTLKTSMNTGKFLTLNSPKNFEEEFPKNEARPLMNRNSSVPNLRSDLVLPQITAPTTRNARITQNDSSPRQTKGNQIVPKGTIILQKKGNNVKRSRNIEVDNRLDFTCPIFLKQLRRLFPQTNGMRENKIMIHDGGAVYYVSSKHAERILQYLEDELKTSQKLKANLRSDSEVTDTFRNLTDESKIIENLDSALTEILAICDDALIEYKHREPLNAHLKNIVKIGHQCLNSELVLYCMYVQGQAYAGRNDIKDAISHFKSYKSQCTPHKLFSHKVHAYKNLGKCYQDLRKHKTALIYFTKFLQMAWYLDSMKYEFLAYDYIGRQYYYLGKTEKANYYHSKMTNGKSEPKTSRFRQVAVYRIAINKDTRNKYLHYEQQANLGFIEGEDNFDDEDREISSREEAIDLPEVIQDEVERKPHKHDSIDSYGHSPERNEIKPRRKLIMPKKELKSPKGEKKGHKRNFSGLDTKIIHHGKGTDSLAKLKELISVPYPKLLRQKNPNDEIILSHLSRNRNIRTFNLSIGQELAYKNSLEGNGVDPIGPYEARKVKKTLEKFRANIELVKQSLQIFEVGNEIMRNYLDSLPKQRKTTVHKRK